MKTRCETPGIRPFVFVVLCFMLYEGAVVAQNSRPTGFPKKIDCKVQPFYRHRSDGMPGREVVVYFKGASLVGTASLDVRGGASGETHALADPSRGLDSAVILLPAGIGVKRNESVTLILRQAGQSTEQNVQVPAMRHWTVYIYPHSHVDIGYSNTHANVEYIHRGNIDYAIALAESTKNFPADAQYCWNTEVL